MTCRSECPENSYVAVWYIVQKKTKVVIYPKKNEAVDIFRRTVNKFTATKEPVHISLRGPNHDLLGDELLNYIPIEPPKRKRGRK